MFVHKRPLSVLLLLLIAFLPHAAPYEWMSALKLPSFNMDNVKVRVGEQLSLQLSLRLSLRTIIVFAYDYLGADDTQTHTHVHTHTYIRKQIHTRTHTHTHTHTWQCKPFPDSLRSPIPEQNGCQEAGENDPESKQTSPLSAYRIQSNQ